MKKMILRITMTMVAAILCLPVTAVNGQDQTSGSLKESLTAYMEHSASQKLYLHLNKNDYRGGETIWFRAYLVDAMDHKPDTAAANVYVDLINSAGVLMERRLLLARDGVAEGDINLPLTIPDGNYYLRAYTDLMKNFGEDFYYTSHLYVSNSRYEEMIPRLEVRSNRRFNRSLNRMTGDFRVAFFPEGGNLVQGVTNRVAFKAVDGLGRGLDVEGEVKDPDGNLVATIGTLHSGMGSFEFKPEAGKTYTASVVYNGSRAVDFSLPSVKSDGIAILASIENDNVVLELSSARNSGNEGYSGDLKVIGHTRGRVIYSATLFMEDGKARSEVPIDQFPSGIAHFTVFSADLNPLAERLVFVNHDDGYIINPRVFRTEHEGRQYLGLQVEIIDNDGNPVEGHFSMSVLTGDFDAPGIYGNILTNLLLSSELDGYIENPQEYFDRENDMEVELDHLMMTHGWRRFDWESVIAGEMPVISYQPASTLSIEGRITDPAKNEPVNNYPVEMIVYRGDNDRYSTRTDNRGNFVFGGLEYPDNFRVEISSRRLPADYPPEIELLTGQVRGLDYEPNIYTREQQITRRGSNWSRVADAGRSPYAPSRERSRSPQSYGVPDQTIYIDRERVTQRTVYEVLVERGHGIQIVGGQIMFRGPSSINLSSEPVFMLDGVQTSRDNVLGYNPREVERIELFRGTSAAIFGVRGGSGVIIAYTRQAGDRGFQDSKEYLITGYHSPREFYSDFLSGSPPAANGRNTSLTVHWEAELPTGSDEDLDNAVFFPYMPGREKMKIVIEGIGSQGGIAAGEFTIELR